MDFVLSLSFAQECGEGHPEIDPMSIWPGVLEVLVVSDVNTKSKFYVNNLALMAFLLINVSINFASVYICCQTALCISRFF